MLTSSDFAAIASSSIVVRQLPPTTFTGICTELAAFTLSSISCYHITLCSMLRVITYSGRTCAPSDMRTECQHHRAVALTEMRKAIEQPEVAHQDVTLFVVLSLADTCSQRSQSLRTARKRQVECIWKGLKHFYGSVMIRITSERTLYSNIWFPTTSRKIHKRLVTNFSTAMT